MAQTSTTGAIGFDLLKATVPQIVDPSIRPWISDPYAVRTLTGFILALGGFEVVPNPQFRTYHLPRFTPIGFVASVASSTTVDGQTAYPITLSGASHNLDADGTRSPFTVADQVLVNGIYQGLVLSTNKTTDGAHVINVKFASGINMATINPTGKPIVKIGNQQEESAARKEGRSIVPKTFLNNVQSFGSYLDMSGLAAATHMRSTFKGSASQANLQLAKLYDAAMLDVETGLLLSDGGDFDNPDIINGRPAYKTLGLIPAIKQKGDHITYNGEFDTIDDFDDLDQRATESMSVNKYTIWCGKGFYRGVNRGLNSQLLRETAVDWTAYGSVYDDTLAQTLGMTKDDLSKKRSVAFDINCFEYAGTKFEFSVLPIFDHPEILNAPGAAKSYSGDAMVIPMPRGFIGRNTGEAIVGPNISIKTMRQEFGGMSREMLFVPESRGRKETGKDAFEHDIITYAGGGWDNLEQMMYIEQNYGD